MEYNDGNRGKLQFRARARQIISFEGMKYGNGSPTDIDALIEWKDRAYILMEFKLRGAELPGGQKLALQRMIDDFERAGKLATLLVCEHEVDDPEQDVIAREAMVRQVYFAGEWFPAAGKYRNKTVDEAVRRFIEYADRQRKF